MTWIGGPPLAGAFAAFEEAVTEVLASKAAASSREEAQDAVTRLLRVRHRMDAAHLHLLRNLGDAGSSPSETAQFLSCAPNNVAPAQARKDVEAAKVTDPSVVWDGVIGGVDGDRGALQHLGDALAAGEASRAHLDVAVGALKELPTTVRRATSTFTDTVTGEVTTHRNAELLDALLTRHARRYAPATAKRLAEELILTIDPDHDDRTFRDPDAAARRGLTVRDLGNGVFRLTVDLDETAKTIVTQAVDAESAPLPTQIGEHGEAVRDPRSKPQRSADGLVTLVQRGAAAGAPVVAETAKVSVVATVADVQAALDHRDGQTTATVDGHGPISTSSLGYLVCGASLQRVLTSPSGAVLDLGRNVRIATPSQRKALAVRDGGCAAPGCVVAAWACEAHHFPEWENGGRTDLDTMVLLCPLHHRAWHAHHLDVRLTPDRVIEARWVTWSTRWPGQSKNDSWVRNTYADDRKLTRELGARLRADSSGSSGAHGSPDAPAGNSP